MTSGRLERVASFSASNSPCLRAIMKTKAHLAEPKPQKAGKQWRFGREFIEDAAKAEVQAL